MVIDSDFVDNTPHLPGCYLFKDESGRVLYVGKAKDLQKRLRQYCESFRYLDPRIKRMFEEAKKAEVIDVGSEIEALILEANLIKKYRPKYNVVLKDDKSYVWVVVTREHYPRVYKTRKIDLSSKDRIFGPYPDSGAITETLKFLQTLFPYRSCRYEIPMKNPQKCLYYHISPCRGLCDGTISQKQYQENIKNIVLFLRSKKKRLIEKLRKEMEEASKHYDYENAAKLRDQIEALETISKRLYVEWGQDEYDVAGSNFQRVRKGLMGLIKRLRKNGVGVKMPKEEDIGSFRIECYDISNISGKEAAGAMVVFIGGLAEKKHYRRFKIRGEEKPNDYQMLQEVFSRRFAHLIGGRVSVKESDPSFSSMPDLILVDGGKGQLSTAERVLTEGGRGSINIPIVGLSKKKDEVWVKNHKRPLRFKGGCDELFLLQRIRDEAHRFAITYHRKLRRKMLFS